MFSERALIIMARINFTGNELNSIPEEPGIYGIYLKSDDTPLKIGIGGIMKKRLKQHMKSKQNALKTNGTSLSDPNIQPSDVTSKQSILTKHLFFDNELARMYSKDFKTEKGRQAFLVQDCYILYRLVGTREDAVDLERPEENSGLYRYAGPVLNRN